MAPGTFTFLHAADLHLDSPLRGLSTYPGAPAERIRVATREAFERLVDAAIERKVNFVVLAGDLFDGDWKDHAAGLWLMSRLARLSEAGIRSFLIRGNHDAESKMTKRLSLPDGAHEFPSRRAETVRIDELGVALHGRSYAVPHVEANLVPDYPAPVAGLVNVGLLHTGLEGYEGHGHYAPCTLADLRAKGYDYWALGHIHQREVVSEDPWIVFPGNVQGRHVRETGVKGATLVRVDGGRIASVEALALDVVRWSHVRVDLAGIDAEPAALRLAEDALRAAHGAADGCFLAARVTLHGATELDGPLRVDPLRVRDEVRLRARTISGDIWIEKVRVETQPGHDLPATDEGLVGLGARMLAAELDDAEKLALAREFAWLSDSLPQDVRETIDPGSTLAVTDAADPARRFLAALLAEQGVPDGATEAEDDAP